MRTILITGCCGFIGYHLTKTWCSIYDNDKVIGIDNMNNYYDVKIKENRLKELNDICNFEFIKCDITDSKTVSSIFDKNKFSIVINLAAQAGVRYSITNPDVYIESNILGFYIILEQCRKHNIEHLIYASSSSVYGLNNTDSEEDHMYNNPQSLYAATKICDEVLAKSYSNMYKFKTTGLRFFTVYGPNGRPDMAYWKFVERALDDRYIELYGDGELQRDFTYIDDIVNGIIKSAERWSCFGRYHRIINLGNNNPITVNKFVKIIEEIIGFQIPKRYIEIPVGDVRSTYANIDYAYRELMWEPKTDLKEGLTKFINWYKNEYKMQCCN